MKNLTKDEPKYITLFLVNLVGEWVVLKLAPWVLKTNRHYLQNLPMFSFL